MYIGSHPQMVRRTDAFINHALALIAKTCYENACGKNKNCRNHAISTGKKMHGSL